MVRVSAVHLMIELVGITVRYSVVQGTLRSRSLASGIGERGMTYM